MLIDRFSAASEEMEKELRRLSPDIPSEMPIAKCIDYNSSVSPRIYYLDLPKNLIRHLDIIESRIGAEIMSLYLKYLLCCCVASSLKELEKSVASRKLTQNLYLLYLDWFERIEKDLSTQPGEYYNHKASEGYRQDLAVAGLRAIPIGGAWLIEFRFRDIEKLRDHRQVLNLEALPIDGKMIPSNNRPPPMNAVRDILKSVLPESLRDFLIMWTDKLGVMLGSYDLYVVIHTAVRERHRFTAKYMTQGYCHIAELMRLRPELAGIYRASWFLDPALKQLSPRLSFLWEVPFSHGARLYYHGPNFTTNPLIGAPQRQKAFDSGEYVPRNYAYVWPREEMLAWASTNCNITN